MKKEYPCETCGKKVEKSDARLRIRPHVFCSRECLKAVARFKCTTCGKPIHRKASRTKEHMFCSKECLRNSPVQIMPEQKRGEDSPYWKGGTYRDGYHFVKMPGHPNARPDGYIAMHRFVMSQHLGRPLESWEIVHHKDEDTLNNDLDNLELMTIGPHGALHRAKELHGWRKYIDGCLECGTKDRRHWAHGLCVRCYMRKRASDARFIHIT